MTTAWPKGSIKDVAESLGIPNLSDDVSTSLAADVEYRLREVIEESIKFSRHAKRTRLKVEDVDYALRAKNIEPLWGFSSTHTPINFKKTQHASGNLYYIDDEEIDLARLSQAALPPIPREVSYTAHWLAVEGVQPAIPQNPSPAELRAQAASARSSGRPAAIGPEGTEVKPLVAHALSKELQLYFDRLTTAAADQDETMRAAALESFRGDTGLQGLVAYLVQWVAERVVASLNSSLPNLDQALDILEAMLQNPSLFVEPYLHQILPPVLSILLTSSLGPNASLQTSRTAATAVRQHAASFLNFILQRYSGAYRALKPRILQTILRGLVNGCSSDTRNAGSLVGSVLGIQALGRDTVRRVFGAKSPNLSKVGEALQRDSFPDHERQICTDTILEALQDAYPSSPQLQTFDYQELLSVTGLYFAGYINSRCTPSVPRGILADADLDEGTMGAGGSDSPYTGNGVRRTVSSRSNGADGGTAGGEGDRDMSVDVDLDGDAEAGAGDDDDEDDDDIDMDAVNA